jgi:hypothetical protein
MLGFIATLMVKKCIWLECDYCAKGVPMMSPERYPGDNNLYHTGTVKIGDRDVDASYAPCRAYKIRRHFNLLTESVADGR